MAMAQVRASCTCIRAAASHGDPMRRLSRRSLPVTAIGRTFSSVSSSLLRPEIEGSSPPSPSSSSRCCTTMAGSGGTTRVVEHVVMFRTKMGATRAQLKAMVNGLRSLRSIDTIIELSAGPSLLMVPYTHALHCRYRSKEDLAAYANHPSHLEVISKFVAPIVEETLAVDWEADVEEPTLRSSYGAVRVLLFIPSDRTPPDELSRMVDAFGSYKKRFPYISQVSVGKNFSPARAQGLQWGFIAQFPTVQDVEKLTAEKELEDLHNSRVRPYLHEYVIMDYSTTLTIGASFER